MVQLAARLAYANFTFAPGHNGAVTADAAGGDAHAVGAFHGPGIQNADLSVFKRFSFRENWRLEFRTEFFNAFNHANFNNPTANIAPSSIGSFGRSFSTVTDPREIQFALKVYF